MQTKLSPWTINGQKVMVRGTTKTMDTTDHKRTFARLAAITNMHNPPQPRKGKQR